ncbi:unnamed protein product, partial [Oikopleura dioica]
VLTLDEVREMSSFDFIEFTTNIDFISSTSFSES